MTKDDIGKTFKKSGFNIAQNEFPRANHIVEGQRYAFLTLNNDDNIDNVVKSDGLLFQVRGKNEKAELVPAGSTRATVAHVFFRKSNDDPSDSAFYYLGECTEIIGINDTYNKFVMPISQTLKQQF